MGYDDCECFECYNRGMGNNPCEDTGSHCETCLKCIHEMCGGTTNRVTNALRESFNWNCDGRCTKCDSTGITIAILLCEDCSNNRNTSDPDEFFEFCFMCDYEGERHHKDEHKYENEVHICRTCEDEFKGMCTKRIRGEPTEPEWWDTMFPCFKCGGYAGKMPVCNYHAKMIGCNTENNNQS